MDKAGYNDSQSGPSGFRVSVEHTSAVDILGGILVSEEKCEAHGPTGKPDLPPRASTDA